MREHSESLEAPGVPLVRNDRLRSLVSGQVSAACFDPDEQRDRLVDQIKQRYGNGTLAVLIYGSYLRGKRDTLLDFYVLLDSYRSVPRAWQGWLANAMPPNVYQIQHGAPPQEIRAKYALLTLERFEHAMQRDFHSYFWARFAQPCGIVYCRNQEVQNRVVDAICQASATFAYRVAPRLPVCFDARQLWTEGLRLTYQCELRSEPAGHAEKLFSYWPEYYRAVTAELAVENLGFEATETMGVFHNTCSAHRLRWAPASWWLRRMLGKVLSTLRIIKAALTFEGALEYLLWKIQRHSGVYIKPTPLQCRYPAIFAWPLLWRLWRKGAFR